MARIDFGLGKTHLTSMGVEIKLSSKGQVVIPKEMRDALGLKPGQSLEAVRTGGGILLRPAAAAKSGRSFEEITAEIRKLYKHEGPPATIEDMNTAVDRMFREEWGRD